MKDHMTVEGRGGTFTAYIARPEELPAPAVIVLQELFGVNADIREKCDELAERGFIAIAPDLFWRQEPAVDLGVRGSMVFASIKPITEMRVLGISRTPSTPRPRCPSAPARLPYLATASER